MNFADLGRLRFVIQIRVKKSNKTVTPQAGAKWAQIFKWAQKAVKKGTFYRIKSSKKPKGGSSKTTRNFEGGTYLLIFKFQVVRL